MHIYGPSHLHGPQPVNAPHTPRAAPPTAKTDSAPIRDELEISDAARIAEQAQEVPEIRQERVDAIRAQIAAGTYETQDKLDAAVDRLLDEIG